MSYRGGKLKYRGLLWEGRNTSSLKENTLVRLGREEHPWAQGLLVVALLDSVALHSLEFETTTRKYHLDVDLLSSSLQVTELIAAECEVLEICWDDRDLI